MAYRKVDESSLTQVANAIRNKAGTSAKLNFPTGFANAIAAIPTGGGGITPTGTITITENGMHYVANYENANVALPEVEQATPSISVSSSGLITASVTQEAGVVPAGTETATKQLTTQSAKTVTPGTSNQTAVSSGRYTTGTVTVKGDANLVARNIKKDVSIFGVTGTLETESAEQATPEITVSSGGLITATAGDKSATKQLTTQTAKTVTPGTSNQTAVYSGIYTTGAVTVVGDSDLVAGNIKKGVSIFNVTGTLEGGSIDDFFPAAPFTYTVDAISGASYGFALNASGYYESQNKAKTNSYAICRVNFNVKQTSDIVFDVINYAEPGYDYGLLGSLDVGLAASTTADSSSKKNFKTEHSASVVTVTYAGVTPGSHFVDVKFIKDGSQDKNNDSIQFKIQNTSAALPQETIDHILQADSDLVPGNIRAGVDIFGVIGTLVAGGGMPDGISAVATGTFTLGGTITNPYTIAHDLGIAPDFVVVFGDANIDLSRFSDEQFFNVIVRRGMTNHNTVSESEGYQVLVSGHSKNTYPLVQALTPAQVASQLTASSFTIHAESYYKLTFRCTYRWIAGVLG